jgi:large subunit ribosomal protein L21
VSGRSAAGGFLFGVLQTEYETVYAIVATGGRQYRVEAGQRLEVEKVTAEAGTEIVLPEVLLVGDGETITVGTPTIPGARVVADVLGEVKGKKIIVFKYKNKVRYRRKTGHRQRYSRLQIKEIQHGS